MVRVTPLVFMVLGLAFAADLLGTVAGPLSLLIALALIAVGLIPRVAANPRPFRPLLLLSGIAALLLGLLLLSLRPDDRVNRLLALSAIIAASGVIFRAFGRDRQQCYPVAAGALLAALVFLVLEYSPTAAVLWQHLSLAVSRGTGSLVGKPLALGPSYSGFNITVLVGLCVLAVFAFSHATRWYRLALALVYLAATVAAYQFLMTLLPSYAEATQMGEVAKTFGPEKAQWLLPLLARHVPWNVPLLLVLAQLPALWIVGNNAPLRPLRFVPRSRRDIGFAAAGAALLVAVAFLLVRSPERPRMNPSLPGDALRPRVVIYEKGLVNFLAPDYNTNSYGAYSSGMFGRLPLFLGQLGFDPVLTSDLSDNTISTARIVVIINPLEIFPKTVKKSLQDFVERGGSLLVLGDHTWLNDAGEDTLNDLLAPTDIRFNFDSAYYQIGGWIYNYGLTADPIWFGMRPDQNEPGVGIGASLHVTARAAPLLWGEIAYSDIGIRVRRQQLGYLGDMRYTPGEPLGDLVLMAEQKIGQGRVVVAADTTGFINLLMVGSHDVVSRTFAKLAAAPIDRHDALRLAGSAVFLVGACVLVGLFRRRSILPLVLAGLIVGFVRFGMQAREAAAMELLPRGSVALVDVSHAQAFSRETWRDDAIGGLHVNLMRSGLQPLQVYSFDAKLLSGARMLFIVSPERTYTSAEAAEIEQFVRNGGYVVVSAGAESADAVAPVLSRFGLRVRNVPFGQFMMNQIAVAPVPIRFHVACQVEDLTRSGTGVWAYYNSPATAVVIERLEPAGAGRRGGLLVIADDEFFFNLNLEMEKAPPFMENINFLRWLVWHIGQIQGTEAKP